MSGKACRNLSLDEVKRTFKAFTGRNKVRNRTLFILGCYVGFRISDLLRLTLKDVVVAGQLKEYLSVNEQKTGNSRTVLLTDNPKKVLKEHIREMEKKGYISGNLPLFCTSGARRLKYGAYLKALHIAYRDADVYGDVATHCMKKTYTVGNLKVLKSRAKNPGDGAVMTDLKKLTGHKSMDALIKYIPVSEDGVQDVLREYGSEEVFV